MSDVRLRQYTLVDPTGMEDSVNDETYNEEVKNHCRNRLIQHAVKSLTTERDTSVCVQRNHVREVWDKYEKPIAEYLTPNNLALIEEEIRNWERFHDSRLQNKDPSDLRVCYISGPNPINDLEVFIDNGVLCQNLWAIEKKQKVIKEALENVGRSNMKNIRLFEGNLQTFLKDFDEQFDIIYFDACGALPSHQETLKVISYIFLENKLTSPGALITNFSFPPEDEKDATEKEEISNFAKTYLKYRLWNTKMWRFHYDNYEDLYKNEISSRSPEDNYDDYITFQVIDSAYLYMPAYKMLRSGRQSLSDQIFERNSNVYKDATYQSDLDTKPWMVCLGEALKSITSETGEEWFKQIFPDRTSSMNKNKLLWHWLPLTNLLSLSDDAHQQFIRRKVRNKTLIQECLKKALEMTQDFVETPFYSEWELSILVSSVVGVLYGQMAHPSFLVMNKPLRLKYTAKKRQMFSDVFIFDKCRYLFDNFPSIHFCKFALKELWQKMLFYMITDGLRKHIEYVYNDVFVFCDRFLGAGRTFPRYIPDREILDFDYFREKGDKLKTERKFGKAIECYNACQELCLKNENYRLAVVFCLKAEQLLCIHKGVMDSCVIMKNECYKARQNKNTVLSVGTKLEELEQNVRELVCYHKAHEGLCLKLCMLQQALESNNVHQTRQVLAKITSKDLDKARLNNDKLCEIQDNVKEAIEGYSQCKELFSNEIVARGLFPCDKLRLGPNYYKIWFREGLAWLEIGNLANVKDVCEVMTSIKHELLEVQMVTEAKECQQLIDKLKGHTEQ